MQILFVCTLARHTLHHQAHPYVWLGPGVGSGFCDWLRNNTLLDLILGPAASKEGDGLIQGVEQWLLLRSHWSNNFQSSSGVGPPEVSIVKKTQKDNKNLIIHFNSIDENNYKKSCRKLI